MLEHVLLSLGHCLAGHQKDSGISWQRHCKRCRLRRVPWSRHSAWPLLPIVLSNLSYFRSGASWLCHCARFRDRLIVNSRSRKRAQWQSQGAQTRSRLAACALVRACPAPAPLHSLLVPFIATTFVLMFCRHTGSATITSGTHTGGVQ